MTLKIIGGRLVDPSQNLDRNMDLVLDEGSIKDILPPGQLGSPGRDDIDASGKVVMPGLVDIHTHLREPGYEYKETIASGTRAAAAGGFTTIACMANTDPVNDDASVCEFIIRRVLRDGAIKVLPVGAVTRGLQGKHLADIGELKSSGVMALSDDGNPIMSADVMSRAMEYAHGFGLKIIDHCEDLTLKAGGHMNEGFVSTRIGLEGIPVTAEQVHIARDILLSDYLKIPIHIAHVSSEGSVDMIRQARARGIPISCETAPHYFSLTDKAVKGYSTFAKVNPPLRTEADRQAIIEGIKDGTIQAIASDHAPHDVNSKALEFVEASWGISGLETSFALSMKLVHEGVVTLSQLVERMAWGPARIFDLPCGTLKPGAAGDVTVADPELTRSVDPDEFLSSGRNTPFAGWTLKGWPVVTICEGKVVFKAAG
jgi:dihydroorotase